MTVTVEIANQGDAASSNVEVTIQASFPTTVFAATTHGTAHVDDDRTMSASTGPIAPGETATITMFRRSNREPNPPDLQFDAWAQSVDWSWADFTPGFNGTRNLRLTMNTDVDCDCAADPLVYNSRDFVWSSPTRNRGIVTLQSPVRLKGMIPAQRPPGDPRQYSLQFAAVRPNSIEWLLLDETTALLNNFEQGIKYRLSIAGSDATTGYNPINGQWYPYIGTRFPRGGFPVLGDFIEYVDIYGNGISLPDPTVYYPESGVWVMQASGGTVFGSPVQVQFGFAGSLPAPGDFDGDGFSDVTVYHPASGNWYMYQSSAGFKVVNWGFPGAWPVQEDYDADNIWDLAVFYPKTGRWYIFLSSTQSMWTFVWGGPGNEPAHLGYQILKQAGLLK